MPDEESRSSSKKEDGTSQTGLDVCAALGKLLAQAEARQAEAGDEDENGRLKNKLAVDVISKQATKKNTTRVSSFWRTLDLSGLTKQQFLPLRQPHQDQPQNAESASSLCKVCG